MIFKVMTWAISELLSFTGSPHVYRRYTYQAYVWFSTVVSTKNLKG